MTAIPLHPRTTSVTGNAAGETAFLRLDDRVLTAGQVVVALGSYLTKFGDNFHGEVDPTHGIIEQVRYGDIYSWQQTNTLKDAVAVLIRAEQVACDYFGCIFPGVNLVSRP